jgi:osmotically-inducible protein OsmY
MKTDAQLQQDVIAELKWEPSINAEDIGVEVKDGVVTLVGHVSSYAEKRGAETAAQRVAGVKALVVEMDIILPGPNKPTDADIARSAENVLEWLEPIASDTVKVMVEGGWITLSGEVDWDFKRAAAARAVHYLMGVTGITNDIALKAAVSQSTVKSGIEAALKRRASADAQNIWVDVRGGDITLSGSVHSWSERDLARQAVWSTPGVRNVVDNLSIAY